MIVIKFIKRVLDDFLIAIEYNSLGTCIFFTLLNILRIEKELKIQYCGITFFIRSRTGDIRVLKETMTNEYSFLEFIEHDKSDNYFIVDGGGYIGSAAIKFALLYPNATIISIEPDAQNYKLLVKNTKAFKNIVPLNKALTKPGVDKIQLYKRSSHWGNTIVGGARDIDKNGIIQEVSCTNLATLLKEFHRESVFFIKLDIEGAELEVLPVMKTIPHSISFTELHERFAPGCELEFKAYSENRINLPLGFEKILSIDKQFLS